MVDPVAREKVMKRAFATRARATRVFLPVALAGVLVVSEIPTVGCVCVTDLYRPGFDAVDVYVPGARAVDLYRPGADAIQQRCC
jgi:hypothetical protein